MFLKFEVEHTKIKFLHFNYFCNSDGQNNSENNQQHFEANHVPLQQHSQMPSNTGEGTFRHPLPPGIIRPRLPIQPNLLIRNSIGNIGSQYLI